MENMYTYLFTRQDLSLPAQIVQTAHAAHKAGERFGTHSHMVLSGAKSEAQLWKIAQYLESKGIMYEMFFEPDNNTGHTAICTEPLIGERRNHLKRFSLLKAPLS